VIDWPAIVDGGIPVIGGLAATAVGLQRASQDRAASRLAKLLRPHLKWLGPVVIAFGLFNGWQTHVRSAHPSAEQLARGIASRASLPKKVDAITTADDVTGVGNTITFHYSVAATLKGDDAAADAEAAIHHQFVTSICNSNGRDLLTGGYVVEGRYRFADGRELLATVTAQSCVS